MECNRQNFLSFWAIFCPFTPITQKIKIWKNKNAIILHLCTKNLKYIGMKYRYVYLKYIDKILENNLFFHSSGNSSRVTTGIGGAFFIWPNITPQKSLPCGFMMGHWSNITLVPATFTPNYGVMVSC